MNPEDGRPYGAIADKVRSARESKGMSQRQLSAATGMSEGYIGHLERGQFRPSVRALKALSENLGLLYGQLALLSGYITEAEFDSPIEPSQLARLNEVSDLTDEEWESVRDYARYVRSKRGQ